jgi:hypothetical protein
MKGMTMLGRVLTVKGLAVLGVLGIGVGTAAAATGSLPSQAQDGLANAASHVGITLPASHDNHPTKDHHPGNGNGNTGPSASAPTSTPSNHGTDVSQVARSTDTTGRAHGAAVAAVARGDHGKTPPTTNSSAAPDEPTTGPPVSTPNAGGIGTGSTASGGANSTGASHAAPPASAGSGNAGDHPHRP